MTIDKDFKRRVRDRARKTGESYTTARRIILKEDAAMAFQVNDLNHYAVAIDTRWSARDPAHPEFVGFGPTHWHAATDLSRRWMASLLREDAANVLTLIESAKGLWSARQRRSTC